jgi:hypothetical protein
MGMIKVLGENIERFAGSAVRAKVMQGSERITAKSGPAEIAAWVKDAMKRLDKLVDKKERIQIRENCGYVCAQENRSMIERARARRKMSQDIGRFFESEQRKTLSGTRLVREGNMLYWYFTPHSFSRPMRCYCSLLKGLPEAETVSTTYCLCSQGFVKKYWESVLGKAVRVELLESCLTGAQECKFAIHLS